MWKLPGIKNTPYIELSSVCVYKCMFVDLYIKYFLTLYYVQYISLKRKNKSILGCLY